MNKNKVMLTVLLLALVGCKGESEDVQAIANSKHDAADALTKTTDNQYYHNEKFGLRVEKPEGWYSQSIEETMQLAARGSQIISGEDKNMKAALEASLKSTLTLFSFFEFPPGTPGKPNSSVISLAEYIAAYPGIKDGCDYLANMKQVIQQSQMAMSFGEVCQKTKLSTSTFGYIDATAEVGNTLVRQRYLACKKADHAIAIIQTFYNEQQEASTTDVVKSIDVQCDDV
jgi:hypothetical protein